MKNCVNARVYCLVGIQLLNGSWLLAQTVIVGHVKIAVKEWRKDGGLGQQLVARELPMLADVWILLPSPLTKSCRISPVQKGYGARHGQRSTRQSSGKNRIYNT